MSRTQLFALLVSSLGLTACGQGGAPEKASSAGAVLIDQANLCEVSSWDHEVVKKACTPGQKVVYLPERFGNAQLPIFFAAVNCDLRYTVALTAGAVTCIYAPITPASQMPATSDAATSE